MFCTSESSPAAVLVWAHPAAPVVRIVVAMWQQFTGARRLDDSDGAVAPELRPLSVERYGEVQLLTGVGVDRGEQRGVGDVEISLIERDLRRVLREGLLESVALERAPVLGIDCFAFPHERIDQISARQVGAVNDNSVSVPAQRATRGGKRQRFRWCEPKAGCDQALA